MDSQPNQFRQHCIELLGATTVASLPQPKKLIEIDSTTPVTDAFEILVSHNILSAPVYHAARQQYLGFLDVRDIVAYIVTLFDDQKIHDDTKLADVLQQTSQGADKTVSGNPGLVRRNDFWFVSRSDTLLKVAEIMASPDKVHRVAIVEDGKFVGIVTQSNIITFLANNLKETVFDTSSDSSVGQLKIGTSPVLSIGWKFTAIEAFRLLAQKQRSGLALVDGNGRLVGATTNKDFIWFVQHPTGRVLRTEIFEYVKNIREQQVDIKAPLIAVFEHEKLSKIVGLMNATKIHRVFVVDTESSYRTTAVISITDVLKFITKK